MKINQNVGINTYRKNVLDVRPSYVTNQFTSDYIDVISGKTTCTKSKTNVIRKTYFCYRKCCKTGELF